MPRPTWPSSSRKEFSQQTLAEEERLIPSPRKGAAGHPPGPGKVSREGFSEGKVSRGGSRAESALRKGEKKVRTGQCQLWEGGKRSQKAGAEPGRGGRYQPEDAGINRAGGKEVLG